MRKEAFDGVQEKFQTLSEAFLFLQKFLYLYSNKRNKKSVQICFAEKSKSQNNIRKRTRRCHST